jgi:hypothetical protein
MVINGGEPVSSITASDTWALAFTPTLAWTQITASNAPTGSRSHHSAAYDSNRNRMLLFGATVGGAENDVQALNLGASPSWQLVAPGVFAPQSPQWFYSAIQDPLRQRTVIFGGYGGSTGALYAFTPGPPPTWELIAATPGPGPGIRYDHSVIYYPPEDAIIVFGGRDFDTTQPLSDIWKASLSTVPTTWQEISVANPLTRYDHSVIYDPIRLCCLADAMLPGACK